MKKIILLVVALIVAAGSFFVASEVASAHHVSEIWLGEFESCQSYALCRDHLVPPTSLNIDMYDGYYNGVDPVSRCEHMGGIPHWHWSWHYTCLDVDY